MARRVAILLSLSILVACSGDHGDAPGAVQYDSAGVRIVELPSVSTMAAQFQVSEQPVYRVGWNEGDHQFEDVVAGGFWTDGRAAVADGGSTLEIVVLSALGTVDMILGGRGEGPGEFSDIFALLPLGQDTVLVQDPRNHRATFFDGSGVIGTMRLNASADLRLLGRDRAGELLMGPPLYIVHGRRYDTPWLSVPLLKVNPSSGVADTVAWTDWDQSISVGGGDNPFMSGGFATVADGRFVVGKGNLPEIRWLDEQGNVRQITRWRDQARPVPDSMLDQWEVQMRAAFERSRRFPQADIENRISTMKDAIGEPLPFFGLPGPMPQYGGLLADADGNVWIATYPPPLLRSSLYYYVVSPQGEWVGCADMPDGLRVLAIGARHILGIERNALDVQAVSVYRVSPPHQ